MMWIFAGFTACMLLMSSSFILRASTEVTYEVLVVHMTGWEDQKLRTEKACDGIKCSYFATHDLEKFHGAVVGESGKNTITVSLYNVHTWGQYAPAKCLVNSTFTMAESLESKKRFHLQHQSMMNYDGNISTHPSSSVQSFSYYFMKSFQPELLQSKTIPFRKLNKRIVYINSNCNEIMYSPTRDEIVGMIREQGLIVDGLGKCMHSSEFPFDFLPGNKNTDWPETKRKAIRDYAFTIAFENTLEPGYVTEKMIDPLMAGSVPIYHGDCSLARAFIPDPRAIICFDDFHRNVTLMVQYLQHLLSNEDSYEKHREWRKYFDYDSFIRGNTLLNPPWECRVCRWAVEKQKAMIRSPRPNPLACAPEKIISSIPMYPKPNYIKKAVPRSWDGMYISTNNDKTFFCLHGVLHLIPDHATFAAMGFYLNDGKQVPGIDTVQKIYRIGSSVPSVWTVSSSP